MELTEKTLSSQTMFDGRIIHVRRDVIELPNGKEAFREVVDHPGGVCVLALDGEDRQPIPLPLQQGPAGAPRREAGAGGGPPRGRHPGAPGGDRRCGRDL